MKNTRQLVWQYSVVTGTIGGLLLEEEKNVFYCMRQLDITLPLSQF